MVQVEAWQKIQREAAQKDGYVCTILGRRRLLPDAKGGGGKKAAQVSNAPSPPSRRYRASGCVGHADVPGASPALLRPYLPFQSPSCENGRAVCILAS